MQDRDESMATQSLAELAGVILRIAHNGQTPVIVCDDRILLCDGFYVALGISIHAASGCSMRLDLLPNHRVPGWLSSLDRRSAAMRFAKRLDRASDGASVATPTIVLSRTIRPASQVVIGFAGGRDVLPSYAKPIALAA